MTRLIVEGSPVPQGSMKHVGRGRVVHSNQKALMQWRELVAVQARAAHADCFPRHQAVEVDVLFHLPRPKTVTRPHPTARYDLDKLLRAVGDALTGVLFEDDGQVVTWTARKRYAEDWTGAVITVTGA